MKLKGVIPAMVTPFRPDGSINVEALKELTYKLVEWGVHGLFPCSSTGEAAKLSYKERYEVLKTVVDAANGKVPVIAGVGFPDLRRTLKLAKEAEDLGVDALLIIPPYYQRPSPQALCSHYRAVSEHVDLPIVIYNIPVFAGYDIGEGVVRTCVESVSQIVALKDSSGNFPRYMKMLYELGGRISVMQGLDQLFYPSLVVGGPGGFLGGANALAPLEVEIYRLVGEGRYKDALKIHKLVVKLMSMMGEGDFPYLIKFATTAATGIDVGAPRPPASPPGKYIFARLGEELKRAFNAVGL